MGKKQRYRDMEDFESSKTLFADILHDVAKQNEKFLLEQAREVFSEAVKLVNVSMDLASDFAKNDAKEQMYVEKAFCFFAYHVLMPSSYSLLISLLSGSLPNCFRELRLMTEMVAKCYLADLKYSEHSFFRNKLHALEDFQNRRIPEVQFIKEFEETIDKRSVISLWGKLSEEIHGRKFVERVVGSIVNSQVAPGYALMIPIPYTRDDIKILKELRNYIELFREILEAAIHKYEIT